MRLLIGISVVLGTVLVSSLVVTAAKEDREPPVPLVGLTKDESARFEEGRKVFQTPFMPRDGLGPLFNARSCEACHHIPTIGGHGPGYRSNLRYRENGQEGSGRLFHQLTLPVVTPESLAPEAMISKRRPPTLRGLGLIEAISEEDILRNADPGDRDGDGIRGHPATRDGHLMRFGSQAHVGSLFEFVADALRQEMGLTSAVRGFDQELGKLALPAFLEVRIPNPNVTEQTVRRLVDFVSLLAPTPRDTAFSGGQGARGERLFSELACAKCHVPTFRTSAKPFARGGDGSTVSSTALLNQEVAAYSDFLLHDLGPTLDDGVTLGVAKSSEYKTPPLWGLRFHKHLLLHDGRANNVEQAILYHGGEAARSRQRYLGLPLHDRKALIEFLETL
jgi:CxxC motif-containing protein (DUF1111 family)